MPSLPLSTVRHCASSTRTTCTPPLCFCGAFIQSCFHKCWPFRNSHTQSMCSSQPSISLAVHYFVFVFLIIKPSIKDNFWMMECTHETIGRFSCHTQKATPIEKASWMMRHALQVLCGMEGKVRSGMKRKGVVCYHWWSSRRQWMKSTKHKAVFPTQGQCHSSNRKHGQCVLVGHVPKHTFAIIGDVVA